MNVGIIGCGTMGSGIAQVASTFNCKVKVYDINKDALQVSQEKLDKILARLIVKERIDQAEKERIQSNISYVNSLSELKDSDLVIEAIVENLDIKKKVFGELESIVSDECILASNTSSLSITSIASVCKDPSRFIGIHFFNPAPLMKLVEIIPALQTSKQTTNKTFEIINSWKKTTVLAKDTPGFIVNKVARPFYSEALKLYEEKGGGVMSAMVIDWAMKNIAKFRMGPFELMDYIGNDVNYTVTETVFKAFYNDPRYKPSFAQKRLSEAGYHGRKSGRGYYDYSDNAVKIELTPDFDHMEEISARIVVMLINEAADTLFRKIATKEDIDLAMTKGVNYPKGLFAWADEIGIQNCVDQIDALYDEYHEARYRCCPLLRRMAKEGQSFYSNS